MKKVLLVCAMMVSWSILAVDLIKDGKPLARIYVESLDKSVNHIDALDNKQRADRYLAMAVRDLNYHFKKMSGTELEVVFTSDLAQVEAPAIVLDRLANGMGAVPALKSELGEAFRLKTMDGMVLIGGETPAGTAYGIYEMLERLGCDWIMPGVNGEVIPETANVSVGDVDFESAPSFSVRAPWYTGGSNTLTKKDNEDFLQWRLRHKEQSTWFGWHPMMMYGGHVWDRLIKQYKERFDKNPELLAMVRKADGSVKREGPQVETTNPEVLGIFEDYIKELFKKNNWPKDKTVCVGVSPADGTNFSISPESAAAGSGRIDPIVNEPDFTDLQILLCNQLIERMEKDYPNLHLGFYLYGAHETYPVRYKPNRKVVIGIADISFSRFHGACDSNSKTRTFYREIMDKWGKLHEEQGNYMFFRGYNWNLAENFLPYSKLKIWGEDIPYYRGIGVTGFFNEYSKGWAVLAPSNYLEAKLLWNADLKWRDVLARYCRNAFGKGAPFMEKYYLALTERQAKSGHEAGSYYAFPLIYDEAFVKESLGLFEKAEKNAESENERKLVRFARIPVEMLGIFLAFHRDYCSFDFAGAKGKLELMKTGLLKDWETDPALVCRHSILFLDRFYKKFIEDGVKYSTGDYSIAYKIPNRLKTAIDSTNSGRSLGLYKPEINDEKFITTGTFESTWDEQGLIGYTPGSVWYRIPFKLSAGQHAKPIGLFLGGADSIARIWINGNYVGEGRGFAKTLLFDLTGKAVAGDNLLAIQVQRVGISENAVGGLIFPSFIFAGPRLEEGVDSKAAAVK